MESRQIWSRHDTTNSINMNINDKVKKISGKPFKSTFKVNTIKSLSINEQDPKKNIGASFFEDDTIVSIDKLILA